MSERTCQNCKFAGWDPDGPYCANPEVLKDHEWGLCLSSMTLVEFCPYPELPLFEQRETFTRKDAVDIVKRLISKPFGEPNE